MGDVRVLIVDDQEPFRAAMAAVVRETTGFEVVDVVTTAEQALTVAPVVRPDLVLMDVNLPGIDGIEATRRLTSGTDRPVVILLSTYDEQEFDLTGSGAATYVAKAAFSPERLVAAWSAALAGRDGRR